VVDWHDPVQFNRCRSVHLTTGVIRGDAPLSTKLLAWLD